ncbi:MAG TPA: hypothetical protein PKZ08_16335, partial [Vicinamibacterales bacterium]|nr:hypothetical protein [Vicinamibacterales bacterium]
LLRCMASSACHRTAAWWSTALAVACLIGGCGLEREGPYAQPEFRTPDAPLPESEPYVRVISGQVINDPSLLNRSAPPADPVTASPLDTKRLDEVSFTGVPLSGAAIMLTRMVGVNITASAEAANRPVTVYLKNVSARSAIEAICRLNNLWYREDPEMIRLLTREEYGRELVIKSDQQTRLYYLKNASALGVADMIAALMPDQVEYTRPSDESSYGHVGTDGDDPLSSSATSTSSTGSDTLEYSADGTTRQRPSGGVSRSYYGYSASDVSTNYQRGVTAGRVEQLARTSADRQRGEVTADEVARSTGVPHPVALSVFLRNNCIAVRTVQESVHDEIGKIIQALDTPTRQVLLEVKVLRVRLGDGFESVFHLSYTNGAAHQSSIKWLDGADIAGSTLSFGYLDHNISATLKLLKNDHRLHSVATPMLLCANNAPAEFFSGVTRMITTNYDFETRYDDNNHAVDIARPTVEERNIGTTVRIKPSINADGTVTLRFLLELSAVNDNGANIYQVNSTGQVIALPIDTVDNERAESIVVARHGQAVVMGGLISETVSKDRRRVPVAG